MKKIIILLLIAGAFQSCEILTRITLSLGIGASTIHGSPSFKDPVGFQAGVESKILDVNKNTSLIGGLGFSYQGAGYEETMNYGGTGYASTVFSGRVRLSYLNVPLLYRYDFNKGFYAVVGLQPGLLVGAKDKYDSKSYDYKGHVNSFELGLPLGVGYRINDKIDFGLSGTYGLTNIDKPGEGTDHNILVVGLVRYTIDWPKIK